jgi:hypothetical protein
MLDGALEVRSMEELRRYVADTLAQLETLKSDQFQLSQQVLYRAGEPCGIYFCLHGPRSLRLSAIWETDQNTILFYGSCGRRMHRTRLAEAPTIEA